MKEREFDIELERGSGRISWDDGGGPIGVGGGEVWNL